MGSDIYEKQGDIKEAAKILQEVQVETLSKMKIGPKVDYILEQVRLCLACNDFIRAIILSRKVNTQLLSKPEHQEQKIQYYNLMIKYYQHEGNFLEIARAYQHLYNTDSIQNSDEGIKYLKYLCIYSVMAPHSNEQSDIANRTKRVKKLDDFPLYNRLLKTFLTIELVQWPKVKASYESEFNSFPEFQGDVGKELWETFQLRVVEHNIRVIATYYKRINTSRLEQLLDLPREVVEKRLADLVVSGSVYAKIDRPAGIIQFNKPKSPVERLEIKYLRFIKLGRENLPLNPKRNHGSRIKEQ